MTAQFPEILTHHGLQLNLCARPLETYLGRIPKSRRPDFVSTTTACHRGYVGGWEIREDHLCLVAIEGLMRTPEGFVEASLETALPWVKGTLVAKWFSGRVRCPEGRLVSYVHAAFASTYERDRIFEFDHGRLVQEWLVLNPPAPIFYRIGRDGRRSCVDTLCAWDSAEIPDPLGESGFDEVHKVWGQPPVRAEDDEEEGYVIAAAYHHPPR
jgi:hypothetical protein